MFYTYLWLREDGTPYYAGKGKGRRAYIAHAIGSPPTKERIVIYPAQSEQDAFATEKALIWYYGRKDLGTGCLRNFTDGGEGASGASNHKALDMTGKTFGRLTVLRRTPATAVDSHAMWLCRCTCGVEKSVRAMHLMLGSQRSCGCWRNEFATKAMHKANTGKHHSDERKNSQRKAMLGNTYSTGWPKGKPRGTPKIETKIKMSLSQTARWEKARSAHA